MSSKIVKKDQVYEIDDRGFVVEIYVKEFDEHGNPVEELESNIITVRPPDGLYRARWTGTEWVEDKTQAEFDEEKLASSLEPTPEEIEKAEFDMRVINLLAEVGIG